MSSSQESRTVFPTNKYVGAPYPEGQAGCYRLVWEVYRNELGVLLDESNLFVVEDGWGSAVAKARPAWVQIDSPEPYDVVLMYARKGCEVPTHLGVYVGEGKVLHTRRKTGCVLESLEALRRTGIVEGFYRSRRLVEVGEC